MKLRHPFFVENFHQDQPFCSMLMICPYCDFTCEGCQNKHLANYHVKDFSVDELVKEYKSNPFYEGVTLGGLEVSLSGEGFIEDFVDFVSLSGIKNVCIYTRENEENIFIQKLLMELLFVDKVYIKTGKYIPFQPILKVDIGDWSIELGSSNQTFKRL